MVLNQAWMMNLPIPALTTCIIKLFFKNQLCHLSADSRPEVFVGFGAQLPEFQGWCDRSRPIGSFFLVFTVKTNNSTFTFKPVLRILGSHTPNYIVSRRVPVSKETLCPTKLCVLPLTSCWCRLLWYMLKSKVRSVWNEKGRKDGGQYGINLQAIAVYLIALHSHG
jgi:hypothetical protein